MTKIFCKRSEANTLDFFIADKDFDHRGYAAGRWLDHKVCMDRMADAGGNGCRVCSAESDPGNDEIIKDVFQVTIY